MSRMLRNCDRQEPSHRTLPVSMVGCLLLALGVTPAAAQVQVDVRLEKPLYLAGEPVVVVDVRNVGERAIGYSKCDGDVRLSVEGAARRVPPDVLGCFSSHGTIVATCAVDHPPLLQPGQGTTFRYVLKEYDLRPGQYQLTASGKAGVRLLPTPGVTDAASSARFDRALPLRIVAGTERDLRAAFTTLVSDADGAVETDLSRRQHARAAIIESAPSFLESLIARFAVEEQFDTSAIDALGRIASPDSRADLKLLYRTAVEPRRSSIVLALARVGHRDDAGFLANVLESDTTDHASRRYAALGLGHIGGDQAVRYLARALASAEPEVRPSIATALGNTRSAAAVPALIGLFGNNPARNDVCSALRTLTHRHWCDGTAGDPAATRRQWLRWWDENRSRTPIFGPDTCPVDPVAPRVAAPAAPLAKRSATSAPRVASVTPQVSAPNAVIEVTGYAMGLEDFASVRVLFVQGAVERAARPAGSGRAVSADPENEFQYLDVFVPADLTPGRWELVVNANGRRSAPVALEISLLDDLELTGMSPSRPHPSQLIQIATKTPAHNGDHIQLTDVRGKQWRIPTGVSSRGITVMLPDEVADGEAHMRLERISNGEPRLSAPMRFVVTSGPLPLNASAVALMTSVSPGQWTDLVKDGEVAFEVRRVDRIDVEFTQGAVTEVSRATGPDRVHVRVPARLKPGAVSVRTRTWIDRAVSEWSTPVTFTLLVRGAAPTITSIEAGPIRNLVWWSGQDFPAAIDARPGDVLVLRGHFPVAGAEDLRVQVRGPRTTLHLPATDVAGGVRVSLPLHTPPGEWRLVMGTKDGRTPPVEITAIRVR